MIVDDSFSRLTTRMIVHDSFLVSCYGNHWSDRGQKTCCRPLSGRKIHTFTSLSYGMPFSVHIFKPELADLVTLLARLPVSYRQLSRGFIKAQAPGKLTGCEEELAINLPSCFCLLFLLSFIRKTNLKCLTEKPH